MKCYFQLILYSAINGESSSTIGQKMKENILNLGDIYKLLYQMFDILLSFYFVVFLGVM